MVDIEELEQYGRRNSLGFHNVPFTKDRGGSRGGRTRRAPTPPPPLKFGKNMIFWRKIMIFHTKYPQNFRAFLRNWKKYDFLS